MNIFIPILSLAVLWDIVFNAGRGVENELARLYTQNRMLDELRRTESLHRVYPSLHYTKYLKIIRLKLINEEE